MMPNPPPPPPPPGDSPQFRRVQQVIARLRCAACGRPYEPQQCQVIEQREDAWVLSVRCPRCNASGYVVVVLTLSEPSAASGGELSPDELAALRGLPPITADEVIDLHYWLESYGGDMESLLHR